MPASAELLTELPLQLPGRVFRSPMPFSGYDPEQVIFDYYLQEKVSVIVLLAGDQETEIKAGRNLREFYLSQGMQVIHLPIPDFSIPEVQSLALAVEQCLQHAQNGANIAIHCLAGMGRTGVFAGCLAKKVLGLQDDQPVRWIRACIPGALEVDSQVEFVKKFA
jgi:protein-tyrosine phosphatase